MTELSNSAPAPATFESELIPVFQGMIGGIPVSVCDARALYAFLDVGKRFASWITERIE